MAKKGRKDPAAGVDANYVPSLLFHQEVKVVRGKHRGKIGRTFHAVGESPSYRLELILPDGSHIFVDQDQIDFKFEAISVKLLLPPEEHEAFDEVVRRNSEWSRGNPDYSS